MQMKDLRPASQLAQKFGVKCVAYGGPGAGKTPLFKTAPRPVLCVVEPGMLSMRDATNLPAWEAYTPERIEEFFDWVFRSPEARNFDTVGFDSISQVAEIILTQELKRNKDGRKAYGEMSRRVMDWVNGLYFLPNKHIFLIAKQSVVDESGVMRKKPYFPGQDLNVKVPHLFDEILHVGQYQIPGVNMNKPVQAIRSAETFDVMARDRSGKLAELEPPDLAALFNKVMS